MHCNELVFELIVIDDVVACLSIRMCKGDQSRKLRDRRQIDFVHQSGLVPRSCQPSAPPPPLIADQHMKVLIVYQKCRVDNKYTI